MGRTVGASLSPFSSFLPSSFSLASSSDSLPQGLDLISLLQPLFAINKVFFKMTYQRHPRKSELHTPIELNTKHEPSFVVASPLSFGVGSWTSSSWRTTYTHSQTALAGWRTRVQVNRIPKASIFKWMMNDTSAPAPVSSESSSSSSGSKQEPKTVIPNSLEASLEQASAAINGALDSQKSPSRFIVEIDTAQGDMTYTLLKNTLPMVKQITEEITRRFPKGARVIVPDSGTAAMVKKKWTDEGAFAKGTLLENVFVEGMDNVILGKGIYNEMAIIVVSPGASEVEKLVGLAQEASPKTSVSSASSSSLSSPSSSSSSSPSSSSSSSPYPFVMVNPDLVDMGATGLGLAARQLRNEFLSTFDTVYCLKVFPWGCLLRQFPYPWGIWTDNITRGDFTFVDEFPARPSAEEIEEVLATKSPVATSAGSSFFNGLQRFMKAFMKG